MHEGVCPRPAPTRTVRGSRTLPTLDPARPCTGPLQPVRQEWPPVRLCRPWPPCSDAPRASTCRPHTVGAQRHRSKRD